MSNFKLKKNVKEEILQELFDSFQSFTERVEEMVWNEYDYDEIETEKVMKEWFNQIPGLTEGYKNMIIALCTNQRYAQAIHGELKATFND